MHRRWVATTLAVVVVLGVVLTILALLGLGLDTELAGLRLSARNPVRALLAAVAAAIALLYCSPTACDTADLLLETMRSRRRRFTVAVLLLICAGVLHVGLRYGSFVASVADSYGYVTQAEAIAGSPPVGAEPESLLDAWPDAKRTLTPLGWVLTDAGAVAPTYPPGLPLLMAAFLTLWSHSALFLAVPLMACAAIVATCALGAAVDDLTTGIAAAFLLACSPVFLLHSALPMSDVPVTALWIGSLTCAFWSVRSAPLIAGILASGALLVRPNLAPLMAPVLLTLVAGNARGNAAKRVAWFAIGVVPGSVSLLLMNLAHYGSPVASGYGSLGELFSVSFLPGNISRFTSWLLETQTPFVLLGLTAVIPAVARRITPDWDGAMKSRRLLLFAGVTAACYAFYLPFDTWGFLRFLLPAFPVLLILSVMVLRAVLGSLRPCASQVAAAGVIVAIGLVTWERAVRHGVLTNEQMLRRFVDVPRYAAATLPANAIFMTRVYSGSMRYYGARPTIRWDQIAGSSLDPIVETLYQRGYAPYILVDRSEEALFTRAFAGQRYGSLDWSPVAEYRSIETVRIYDPRRRQAPPPATEPAVDTIPVSRRQIPRM